MTMIGSQASHCMLEVVHKHSLQELCPYTSLKYLAAISTAFFAHVECHISVLLMCTSHE